MPRLLLCSLVLLCTLGVSLAFSQTKNAPGLKLAIRKAKGSITLDGKLDEPDWQEAEVARDFYMNYPYDTALAPFQTEARLVFDDHALYISYVCYDDEKPSIVQSLRRDFDFEHNDNIGIYFGPYNDGINGFYFQVTPYNVQSEGTIASGGAEGNSYNATWDNKWFSKVTRHPDRWIAELRIPFKSFRFKHEVSEWNMTFLRWDRKHNLVSSWIATPIQYIPASFAYSGKLAWTEFPPKTTNISLIPYAAGGKSQDKTTEPETASSELEFGMDAKIGVTPSLNLDLTVNPDFSQVEVDRQVVNLTRFEFQFPERRQFFLENSDMFDNMGFPPVRPFFSRRIGLAKDSTGTLKLVPITYGARLSGSLSSKWRIGVLNMQTQEKIDLGLPAQNFTTASLQRNFWKQSNIQFSFVNKHSIGVAEGDSLRYFSEDLWKDKFSGSDTSRVLNANNNVFAVDLESRSADNTWSTSAYYSKSFDNFGGDENGTGGAFLSYTKRNIGGSVGFLTIGKDYNAEAGFVPSKGVYPGINSYYLNGSGTIFPKKSKIANMRPFLDAVFSTLPDGTITDKSVSWGYNFEFLNTSFLGLAYTATYQMMTNEFNPIDPDEFTNYHVGEEYNWGRYGIYYRSDQRKIFRYNIGTVAGGFYNGDNWNVNGEVNYRFQPYGSVSIRFDYNDLRLPDNYGQEKLFVVSPRFDLTFTDKIFLTTFIQYNTVLDNVNLNARFQWRYKPASDFFIVYTENYLPEGFVSKSRALVFKFTYWLNI